MEYIAAKSISTYPLVMDRGTGKASRDGDPNADELFAAVYPNRAILAIADGCNWGIRSQKAAHRALEGVSQYLLAHEEQMDDVMHAGHLLLRALCEANRKIVEGVTDLWEAGTTTVLAGIVLQTTADSGKPEWGLLCASVGDCKALLWNKRTGNFTDITMGNRCTDMRDPGGRLGPYLGKDPDLRNLRLYWRVVYPGDIIIFCTDGIYDNFDPIFLGKSPKDLELPYTVWSGVPDTTQEQKKEEFALKFAKGLMQGKEITPSSLIDTFVEHATNLTSRTRDFMESHPGKKQPADYKLFPGKMDHTTALAFVVGSVPTAVKAQTVTVEIPPPQVEAPLATAVDDKGKKPAS